MGQLLSSLYERLSTFLLNWPLVCTETGYSCQPSPGSPGRGITIGTTIHKLVRRMLMSSDELVKDMAERMSKANTFLYLLFLAPNKNLGDLTIRDLAYSLSLDLETHTVQTEDGYILQLHRIPGTGRPVLLQHGMMCNSACWLTSGRDSLAYVLAMAGFDVWMGNFRGNRYSGEHETMTSDETAYWRFTFHHFGQYDIPAEIRKIAEVTGQKITYIGHSMGSTSMLVAGSVKPEILADVELVILLAPVAAGHTMTAPVKGITPQHRHHRMMLEWMGLYALPPKMSMLNWVTRRPLYPTFAGFFLKAFTGFVDGYVGSEDMISHFPDTASIYTLFHYSQNISEKSFGAYDWQCSVENTRHYGQPCPPEYDLDKMNVPTVIFSAVRDTVSPLAEQHRLMEALPNVIDAREVDLTHIGFIWGKDAPHLVYKPILEMLSQRQSGPKDTANS